MDSVKENKKFKVFLLLPTIESLLARFDERGANDKLRERTSELHKKFLEKKDKLNWQVVDSSNQTLEETVEQIYQELVK
jgi:guanylate kinase